MCCSDNVKTIVIVRVFHPHRGVGGTLAYPVSIDGHMAMFEMNDNCVWESKCLQGCVSKKVMNRVKRFFGLKGLLSFQWYLNLCD
jgi:hypothetical protein